MASRGRSRGEFDFITILSVVPQILEIVFEEELQELSTQFGCLNDVCSLVGQGIFN